MKEIKFRAWDKKRRKWADWIEVYKDGTYNIGYIPEGGGILKAHWKDHYEHNINLTSKDKFGSWNYERDSVLMQFTGLKDKNGKEIYEGDIVTRHNAGRFEISFSNAAFHLKAIKPLHEVNTPLEIIGNIYENPELLTPNAPKQ